MPPVEQNLVLDRTTRPLYLKRVPVDVWERVHVNAIRSGMRLTDYLVAVLATAEPLAAHAVQTGSPSATSPMVPSAVGSV